MGRLLGFRNLPVGALKAKSDGWAPISLFIGVYLAEE